MTSWGNGAEAGGGLLGTDHWGFLGDEDGNEARGGGRGAGGGGRRLGRGGEGAGGHGSQLLPAPASATAAAARAALMRHNAVASGATPVLGAMDYWRSYEQCDPATEAAEEAVRRLEEGGTNSVMQLDPQQPLSHAGEPQRRERAASGVEDSGVGGSSHANSGELMGGDSDTSMSVVG